MMTTRRSRNAAIAALAATSMFATITTADAAPAQGPTSAHVATASQAHSGNSRAADAACLVPTTDTAGKVIGYRVGASERQLLDQAALEVKKDEEALGQARAWDFLKVAKCVAGVSLFIV